MRRLCVLNVVLDVIDLIRLDPLFTTDSPVSIELAIIPAQPVQERDPRDYLCLYARIQEPELTLQTQ